MVDAFKDRLNLYLSDPSPEHFRLLQEALAHAPEYQPYSDGPREADQLLEQDQFTAARGQLVALMPNWFLNPGVHQRLSFVWHKLGDERSARFELQLSVILLEGILSTGDGSEDRPYRVLHTADEYDLLRHLNKQPKVQTLVERTERYFDRQECTDGTQLWFDITWPYSYLQKKFHTKA